jgi:hypothetical protein
MDANRIYTDMARDMFLQKEVTKVSESRNFVPTPIIPINGIYDSNGMYTNTQLNIDLSTIA